MCGIAGIVAFEARDRAPNVLRALESMIEVQQHRGPDEEGLWHAHLGSAIVALGHRRLAIIDLSAGGNQPRVSTCGRYALTYNGELYNYLELRAELQTLGCRFESRSDTEVVLNALATWGAGAFERFNGMWALALVDAERRKVLLSRDRFGEKPLFVYRQGRRLYFSSEVKGILVASGDRFRVHLPAAWRFIEQSLLDAQEETFFEGITAVPPGHVVDIDFSGEDSPALESPRPYWSMALAETAAPEGELLDRVRETFIDAVRLRLRSDVPVGVLLSGGLDSSAIVAAVRSLAPSKGVELISATSDDPRVNEEPYVDMMAAHVGRVAHKVRLNPEPQAALAALWEATWHNDEPIGGLSSLAHLQLMREARDLGVIVILSGQGADESLCGYRKYAAFRMQELHRARRYGALAVECLWHLLPPWSFLSDFRLGDAKRYLPTRLRPVEIPILGPAFEGASRSLPLGLGEGSIAERQILDLRRYSVPALTHYEDRMSMAVSREVRLPFLDHRLVQLLVASPSELKLRRGWSKWLFRKAVEPLLPAAIAWRRDKKGFSTPIADWLRGPWRHELEALFIPEMVSSSLGLLDADRVRARYRAYCEQQGAWWVFTDVFNPMALEVWARRFQPYLAA